MHTIINLIIPVIPIARDRNSDTRGSQQQKLQPLKEVKQASSSYPCKTCGKSFSSNISLQQHRRQTHYRQITKPKLNHKCQICERRFGGWAALGSHMVSHTKERPYSCGLCGIGFPREAGMIKHKQVVHFGLKNFSCVFCGTRKENQFLLDDHVRRVHIREAPYFCNACKAEFTNAKDLKRHRRSHTGEKGFPCQTCPSSFSTRPELKNHIGAVHNERHPLRCKVCDQFFTSKLELQSHTQLSHPHFQSQRLRPHRCDTCGSRFTERVSLRQHIMRVHSGGERPFQCDQCPKTFAVENDVRMHKKKVHSAVRPTFECVFCGQVKFSRGALFAHLQSHIGEKPFFCLYCGNGFASNHGLKIHTRSHTLDKPFRCNECSKSYVGASGLARHKAGFHMMRKRLLAECLFCNQFCPNNSALFSHLRVRHLGEKPYFCVLCGMEFSGSNLSRHMRVHTRERPFQCELCAKDFSSPYAVNLHKRSFHKIVVEIGDLF